MKNSFQDGVDSIYNAIVAQGVTPSNKTPGTLASAVGTVATNKYNAGVSAGDSSGYTRGYNAGNSAGYNSGYNQGVNDADGRTNTNSANYQAGYNAGYTAGTEEYTVPLDTVTAQSGSPTSGTYKMPVRDDASQTASYSLSADQRTAYINVSGSNCQSYNWTVFMNAGVQGRLTITGSSGTSKLPVRNDMSQSVSWAYDFSPADGKRRIHIVINGYECASFEWEIRVVK